MTNLKMTPLEAAAELLLSEDYIVVPIPLANLLGLAEAVLLKKIDAWCASNRKCQKKKYFRNGHWWTNGSYSDWNNRLPCVGSSRTVQRIALGLEKLGLLISDHLSPKKSDRTKWYRVDRVKLGQLYLENAQTLIESIVPDWHDDSSEDEEEDEWVEMHSAKLARSSSQTGTDKTKSCRGAHIYNDSLNDSLNDSSSPTPPKGQEREGGEKPRNGNGDKSPTPSTNSSVATAIKPDVIEQTTVTIEAKSSAATAVITDPFFNKRTPVQQYGKPKNEFGLFESQEEMNEFYEQIMELGKNLGKSQPSGWACKVIQNIKAGDPSVYLNEYRQGIPVGTCEQKEWQCRPGVPHEKFITYLTTRFHKTGMTQEQAIAEAHRRIRNTNEAADLWQACLRTLTNLSADWEKQKAMGVSTPYIPPELQTRDRISLEQATHAIVSLESGNSQALPTAPSPCSALPENLDQVSETMEIELSQEQIAANMRRLGEMMGEAGKKASGKGKKKLLGATLADPNAVLRADPDEKREVTLVAGTQTSYEKLCEELADPAFRNEVQSQAKKFIEENEDYCADYDRFGRIVAIYPF